MALRQQAAGERVFEIGEIRPAADRPPVVLTNADPASWPG